MRLEGLYGLYHFLFLLITAVLGSITVYVFYAKLKDERIQTITLKALAGVWFICGVIHQIAIVYENLYLWPQGHEQWTWAMLIPFTYCSMASFITPLAIILFKKNNRALHFLTYFCFFGGFSIFIAPWLNNVNFFTTSSIFALIHHAFMFVVSILMVAIKYVRPSMKYIYVCPIGMGSILLIGVIERYAFKFPQWIGEPLLKNSDVLTSWWMVSIVGYFLIFVIVFFYELFINKKTTHEIFSKEYLLSDFIRQDHKINKKTA